MDKGTILIIFWILPLIFTPCIWGFMTLRMNAGNLALKLFFFQIVILVLISTTFVGLMFTLMFGLFSIFIINLIALIILLVRKKIAANQVNQISM